MSSSPATTFDLYVWQAPRDLDADAAAALLARWHADGADPARSPFDPSSDVGWFHRELRHDLPWLELTSDAVPSTSTRPVWLSTEPEPPARLVAMRLPSDTPRDALESVFGLAVKYDLVVFNARTGRVHRPMEEMADYASATFWPRGAIQAAAAGGLGAIMALVAWLLGIPILSGVLIAIGLFLFSGAVYTFVHEGRKTLGRRGTDVDSRT